MVKVKELLEIAAEHDHHFYNGTQSAQHAALRAEMERRDLTEDDEISTEGTFWHFWTAIFRRDYAYASLHGDVDPGWWRELVSRRLEVVMDEKEIRGELRTLLMERLLREEKNFRAIAENPWEHVMRAFRYAREWEYERHPMTNEIAIGLSLIQWEALADLGVDKEDLYTKGSQWAPAGFPGEGTWPFNCALCAIFRPFGSWTSVGECAEVCPLAGCTEGTVYDLWENGPEHPRDRKENAFDVLLAIMEGAKGQGYDLNKCRSAALAYCEQRAADPQAPSVW